MTDDNVTEFPKPKRPGGPGRGNKVKQGSGLPAMGDGWGGPAKGAGAGPQALIPGQGAAKQEISEYNRLTEEEQAAKLREKLFTLADSAERQETQLAAAVALLNRIEGMPVSRSISANVGELGRMTNEELLAERERLARALNRA